MKEFLKLGGIVVRKDEVSIITDERLILKNGDKYKMDENFYISKLYKKDEILKEFETEKLLKELENRGFHFEKN